MRKLAWWAFAALAACGGQQQQTGGGAAPQTTSAPGPAAAPATEVAHALVIEANACWFGGLWADAEGTDREGRAAATARRCEETARDVHGEAKPGEVEKLRALEPGEIDAFVAKVGDLAGNDPVDSGRKDDLVKLAKASGAAQRELLDARRAADKIRKDEDRIEVTTFSEEEKAAIAPLKAHDALAALLDLQAGSLTKEANALGLLTVVDRFVIARAIPRHMKVYAIADALEHAAGVQPPELPKDSTKPLLHTELLDYMTRAAAALAHPVPDADKSSPDRYAIAYAGVLHGLADKLLADEQGMRDSDLKRVVDAIAQRLAQEDDRVRKSPAPAPAPSDAGAD